MTRSGRVLAFGRAESFGHAVKDGVRVVGLASTPTGLGYWLFTDKGRVLAYGDAALQGGAVADGGAFVAGDNSGPDGYWLVTERGRVLNYGSAPDLGGVAGKKLGAPIAGLASTATGQGYYLVTSAGRVYRFGDA